MFDTVLGSAIKRCQLPTMATYIRAPESGNGHSSNGPIPEFVCLTEPSLPQRNAIFLAPHPPYQDTVNPNISNFAEPNDAPVNFNAVLPVKQSAKAHAVPYDIPNWSGTPCHNFFLEVLKDGSIIDQLNLFEKGAYMFGRVDLCDFVLEHPTVSRFHAVLQFRRNGDAYLYDLDSTHGTFINKHQVDRRAYVKVHVGDIFRFGHSTRLYIFQGPAYLMPPQIDLEFLRDAKVQKNILDQASSGHARSESSPADDISWGMGEDAIEDIMVDDDEITWQTYKGKLTDKQEKTHAKFLKCLEKIGHMKKEIDAIRAKDISQGGLTQGQQIQIARNEQRLAEIMEEMENLEETLNDSIRDSMGIHSRMMFRHNKKGKIEAEEAFLSDDDEFYDRTKKVAKREEWQDQSLETAETLLDKRDAIMKEIVATNALILEERNCLSSKAETKAEAETGDALDIYLKGLSSQLVLDKTVRLEKDLSTLQSDLHRISLLLKIADPSGKAAKKRDTKLQVKLDELLPFFPIEKPSLKEPKKSSPSKQPALPPIPEKSTTSSMTLQSNGNQELGKVITDAADGQPSVYLAVAPQWLGALNTMKVCDSHKHETLVSDESTQFVDYKDRKCVLADPNSPLVNVDLKIDDFTPGLIIRKWKQTESSGVIGSGFSKKLPISSSEEELVAEDAVALLLKHNRGFYVVDDDGDDREYEEHVAARSTQLGNDDNKHVKRPIGPEKPSFLNASSHNDFWLPPKGQSGDGRTSLNDRYGY